MAKSTTPLNADERKKMACPTALCPYPSDLDHPAYLGGAYNQVVRELIESTKMASGGVEEIRTKIEHIYNRYDAENRLYLSLNSTVKNKSGKVGIRAGSRFYSILEAACDYSVAWHLFVGRYTGSSGRQFDSELAIGSAFEEQLSKFKSDAEPAAFCWELQAYAMEHAWEKKEYREYATGARYRRAQYEMKDVIPEILEGHGLGENRLSGFVADYACGGSEQYSIDYGKTTSNTLFGSSVVLLAGAIKANGTAEAPASLKLHRHVQLSQVALDLLLLEQCKTRGDIPGVDTLRTCAVTLWGLGRRNHKASLELMKNWRILDKNGELVRKGFFNRQNFESAVKHIRATLEKTRGMTS